MKRIPCVLLFVAIGLAGCQPPVSNSGGTSGTPAAATTGGTPGAGTPAPGSAPATTGSASTAGGDAASNLSQDKVPASLKTTAYDYYGLGYKGSLTYSFKSDESMPAEDGTQQVTLTGKQDSPTFHIVRDGSLSQLGSEDIEMKPDGAYTVGSSLGKMDPPSLALPNDLTVGHSFKTDQKLNSNGKVLEVSLTNTITKQEKVNTPAGDYDTYVVETKGTLKQDGKPTDVQGLSWYAKEVGLVKMTLKSKDASGKPVQSSLVLKKKG